MKTQNGQQPSFVLMLCSVCLRQVTFEEGLLHMSTVIVTVHGRHCLANLAHQNNHIQLHMGLLEEFVISFMDNFLFNHGNDKIVTGRQST